MRSCSFRTFFLLFCIAIPRLGGPGANETGEPPRLGPRGGGLTSGQPVSVLFGTDANGGTLLKINVATGLSAVIGPMEFGSVPSLAMDPETDIMYAGRGGGSSTIYTVDPLTAVATLLGSTGLGSAPVVAMDFHPDGTLYGSVNLIGGQGAGGDHLIVIDKVTAQATVVGPYGTCPGGGADLSSRGACSISGLDALASDPSGQLWGALRLSRSGQTAATPGLYRIDRMTGAAAFVTTFQDDMGTTPPGRGIVSLQFTPDGLLYGGTARSSPVEFDGGHLLLIDVETGQFSLVSPRVIIGGRSLGGLALPDQARFGRAKSWRAYR